MLNAISLYLLVICVSLEKCLFSSFAHFLQLDCFLCYWVVWVPYLFWILTSIRCVVCKYFLPFQRLFFHFVNGFVDGFKKYGYFNINSPYARTHDIFPFVSVFNLFRLSLVVFSIEIFHLKFVVFSIIITPLHQHRELFPFLGRSLPH